MAPGVGRVDLRVSVDNPAAGPPPPAALPHRRRRRPVPGRHHVRRRRAEPRAPGRHGWWHPAPDTFPHQGWVAANGPGRRRARAARGRGDRRRRRSPSPCCGRSGWLSHVELGTRPIAAGPAMEAPGAQCPEGIAADLTLRLVDPHPAPRRTPAGWRPRLRPTSSVCGPFPPGRDPLVPGGHRRPGRRARTAWSCPHASRPRTGTAWSCGCSNPSDGAVGHRRRRPARRRPPSRCASTRPPTAAPSSATADGSG